MNLLFICESFPTSKAADFTGGVEARDFYIARQLSPKHHITVITNARSGVPRRQIIEGIHVVRCGLPISHKFRNNPLTRLVFVFASIISSFSLDFDLVQGSNIFSQLPAFIIGYLRRLPRVCLVHDVFIDHWFQNTDLITASIGEVLERLVLRLPWNLTITNSHSTHTKLKQVGIVPHHHTTIPGGVDLASCQSIKATKTSQPTVVFAGRLVDYKHIDDLIAAIVHIKTKVPNIRLDIIGAGPQLHRLQQQVYSLRLDRHVKFLGFIKNHRQVLTHIKTAHIFCLPSTVEGFGLVTLEAAACGTPYVNSDIPASRETTHGGQGGLLFKPRDISDLSRQIVKLISKKKLYHQKVAAAHQLAKSSDWSIIARDTAAAFQSLV